MALPGLRGRADCPLIARAPDSGEVSRSRDLVASYLPQDFRLNATKNVYENIHDGAQHVLNLIAEFESLPHDSKRHEELESRIATLEGWTVPNITTDPRLGIGAWSVDDIVTYLKTGANGSNLASGPMAEVVMRSTALMPEADLRAIAVYLKERATPAPTPAPAKAATNEAGQAIYTDTCGACHGRDGAGVPGIFPRLNANPDVLPPDPASHVRGVLSGAKAAAIISPTLPLAESGPPLLRSSAGPMPSPLAVPRAAPARRRAAARSPGDLRCRPLWQPACPQCCRHDPPRPSHPPHLGGGAGKGTRPQSAVPRRRPP